MFGYRGALALGLAAIGLGAAAPASAQFYLRSHDFIRVNKTKAAGQNALDQFGTRTYSSYVTVAAQYGFCQTAGSIGRDAIFAPRGKMVDLAVARTRELRNSLIPYGEQQLPRYLGRDYATYPRLDEMCWNGKGEWQQRKCGPMNWPASGTGIASR